MRRSRAYAERFASGPALALRNIKRCVYEGGAAAARPGPRARGESRRGAVPLAGRKRGPHRVRREADPELRRSMTTETITSYAGAFIDGGEHRNGGEPLPDHQSRPPARCSARSPARTRRRCRRRRAVGRSRVPRLVGPRGLQARGDPRPGGSRTSSSTSTSSSPLLTREQGKTLRDARIEITKAVDTLMHYVGLVEGAARRAHPEPRPGRGRHRAAPAARRGRRDRAVELPHDAAVATSWRPRSWRATRSSRSRRTRRR